MIKIEYTPAPKKIKKYRAHCICGCIFTYDENDKHIQCFGHGDFWDVVHCPLCNHTIGTPWDETAVEEI